MKIPRLVAVSLLVLSSFAATGVAPTKTELETMYDKAFREFDANHYDEALKALDAIDARQPDLAESQNLRGVVLMRKGATEKGAYDKAEAALRKALEIEPKFWNAQFNLAQIPFMKKDWAEARNRFEALVAGNSAEMKGETSLLIQYKILLTFVLEGKESMVDWIVNKFEGEKDSPALYFSNAAIALQHKNPKEAKEWMDAADKHYPVALNKLFAESLYEVGWLQKPAGETRAAIEITSTAERAQRMKADAQANFERAERAFQQRDFAGALTFLNLADEGAPDRAESMNLRGEIYMEGGKFDAAEDAFLAATKADPKFREAQYNLAQIPFKKKDYAKSRERLEALYAQTPGGEKNQAAQLIKYKIFMTLLLEGNDAQAQQMMDQFKFTGDTPALYYAQAAWAFQHKNTDQGNDWIKSARKIYSPALNIVFADTFYDIGWLQRAPETAPATTALAQANAAPADATPAMRFGTDSLPAPQPLTALAANGNPAASPATAPNVAITAVPPQKVAAATATARAASSPVAALVTQATPAVVAKNIPPVVAQASRTKTAAAKTTSVATAPAPSVASSAAMTPAATALAPARIREYSQPSFSELIDHASEPQTLLVVGLLLGGVAFLGWLVFQQARRHTPGSSLYESALPLTEPPFGGTGTVTKEHRVSRENLAGGPPKLSLQLKASEPAVRKAVLPSGAPNPRASSPVAGDSGIASRNLASESVSEVRPVASTPAPTAKTPPTSAPVNPPDEKKFAPAPSKTPLRDEKEVSLTAPSKPSFLPILLPAKAAATPRPAIIAEPKKPATEPQKIVAVEAKKFTPPAPIEPTRPPSAIEVKPPVPPAVEKPVIAREEPVGQGQPVPQLTSIASAAPVTAAAALTAPTPTPTPKIEEKTEQRPARIEPETAAIGAIAGKAHAQPPVPPPTFAAKAITTKPTELAGPAFTAPHSESPAKPEQAPERLETEAVAISRVTAAKAPQSSVETPAITSNVTATEPTTPPPTTPVIMPEPSPIIAINEPRPAPANGGQPGAPVATATQPNAGLQTAVQLTFSLEIASLQLTPNFKMGSLQVKPISKIVSMRLAPSAQPQPAMNLQVTFELSSIQLGAGGSIGTVRLTPSSAQRPTPITSPSFEISGLQLISSSAASPVQLTPTQQGAASVLMTASFQIATVEFSPSFEIASVVLNSTSKNVAVQLPGAGPSSIEGAPVFEIGNVQLAGNNELGMLQLNPLGGGRRSQGE